MTIKRRSWRAGGVIAAALGLALIPHYAAAEVINRGVEGKPLHEARPAPK